MSEEPSQVESGIHPKLINPLSEETRKERIYLLGISVIGITIVFTGLIPTEINALGITFAEADRKSLLFIFALVVGYFLVAFGSYALSDYLEWWKARRDLALSRRRRTLMERRAKIEQALEDHALDRERRERERREQRRTASSAVSPEESLGSEPRADPEHQAGEGERRGDEMEHQAPSFGSERWARAEMEKLERWKESMAEDEKAIDRWHEQNLRGHLDSVEQNEQQIAAESEAVFALTGPIITFRFVVEFIVPATVGVFAIVALLIRAL